MAERRKCKHCGQLFSIRPQNPDQQYCSEPDCQRAHKRIWQQRKLLTDPDYHANQREAQSRWQEKNPDYWSKYRKDHLDYRERNRARQQERNRRRQERGRPMIAKMDASMSERSINSGQYLLSIVSGFVKMLQIGPFENVWISVKENRINDNRKLTTCANRILTTPGCGRTRVTGVFTRLKK